MGDLKDFWDMLRGKPRKGLSLELEPGGFVTEIRDYRRPSYPASDSASLQSTLTRNELVFACVGVKATAAQDPRLTVQTRDAAGEWVEAAGHPMRALLMRPNPFMTEADLMRAAIVSWDCSNPRKFVCEKVVENGLLTALYPLNPAYITPLQSRTPPYDTIGYVWSDGTARVEYRLDELLIRSAPSWYNPAPLVTALGSVESDTAQTDYIRAFFVNGGAPSAFLKYNRPMNQAQRDDVRERWRAIYGNRVGGQHDIGVLDVDMEYVKTGAALNELDSETLRSVAESRICMAFGVPPLIVYAYVGLLRATYANLKEAWAGFWDATMSPALKEWRDFYTWHLLTEFETERDVQAERVRLRYDLSQVAALQEDVNEAQTRARQNWQVGAATLNETRAALGLQPDPAGDYYLRTMAQLAEPAGQAAAAPAKRRGRLIETKAKGTQEIARDLEKAVAPLLRSHYRLLADAVREGAR